MHRDIVDNVISATASNFIITTSLDGNIKFWKKNYIGIEFVKQYKAHLGKITGISISRSGLYMCTSSPKDECVKIFDILNFDMIHFIKLKFVPYLCEFVNDSKDPQLKVAVTEKDTGNIHILKAEGKGEIHKSLKFHEGTVTALKFNEPKSTLISVDSLGIIEYTDVFTYGIDMCLITRSSYKRQIPIQIRHGFVRADEQ